MAIKSLDISGGLASTLSPSSNSRKFSMQKINKQKNTSIQLNNMIDNSFDKNDFFLIDEEEDVQSANY